LPPRVLKLNSVLPPPRRDPARAVDVGGGRNEEKNNAPLR
jgi:hypothetical protein